MTTLTTHEKLVLARNELAKRGKMRGSFINHAGQVCVYGALLVGQGWTYVDFYTPGRLVEVREDQDFFEALGFATEGDLYNWSDDSTTEEVLARLDEAIARTAPAPEDLELEVSEEVAV